MREKNRKNYMSYYEEKTEVLIMAIVQDAYDIPLDIVTKLATGEYRRIGSVVRYAVGPHKGQIVKHLKPVELKAVEQTHGIGVKAIKFVKEHKKGTIIISTGTAVAVIGTWTYNRVKNREPKVVTEFRVALKTYIDAIRKGNMSMEKINNLMMELEKVKKNKDYKKISIQLTTEELEVLVGRIYEYTVKLAKDNEVDLTEDELDVSDKGNTIISLQKYLKTQKRIFDTVA